MLIDCEGSLLFSDVVTPGTSRTAPATEVAPIRLMSSRVTTEVPESASTALSSVLVEVTVMVSSVTSCADAAPAASGIRETVAASAAWR